MNPQSSWNQLPRGTLLLIDTLDMMLDAPFFYAAIPIEDKYFVGALSITQSATDARAIQPSMALSHFSIEESILVMGDEGGSGKFAVIAALHENFRATNFIVADGAIFVCNSKGETYTDFAEVSRPKWWIKNGIASDLQIGGKEYPTLPLSVPILATIEDMKAAINAK